MVKAFWAVLIFRLNTGRSGRHRMATSQKMFMLAMAGSVCRRLLHMPSAQGCQALLMGVHWKTITKTAVKLHSTEKMPSTSPPIFISRIGKIRQ